MSAARARPADDVRRLWVRLPNWLGDALLARPLLFALRRALPQAEIAATAPAPLLALLETDRTLDRTEPWPPERVAQAALARRLRGWGPDAALVLPPSFSSAWFAARAGARRRIGYRHEARAPLLTDALPRPARGDLHLSAEYLALGARLGAAAVPVPPLRPGADAAGVAERMAAPLGDVPLALLAPGARYGPAKRWAPGRFATVGRALAAAGHAVVVCGTAAEAREAGEVARAIGPRAASIAGHTDLPALAALCARAALAVCNDSGLAHLAAATGTRTVVIFGSTCPGWTAPLGPAVTVLQHAPVCSPCFRRTCRVGYACLEAVEVAEVLAACGVAA